MRLITSESVGSLRSRQEAAGISLVWQDEACASPRDRAELEAELFGFAARIGVIPEGMCPATGFGWLAYRRHIPPQARR